MVEGQSFSKNSWNKSLSNYQSHSGCIWRRKCYYCDQNLTNCQSIEGCGGCRLWWYLTWNAWRFEQRRNSCVNSYVSSGLAFKDGTERLANWVSHPLARSQVLKLFGGKFVLQDGKILVFNICLKQAFLGTTKLGAHFPRMPQRSNKDQVA